MGIVAALKTAGRRLSARLQRHPSLAHVGVLVGATALAQVLAVVAMPILTRLYAPSDFGVLQVYASLFALAVTVVSLHYEVAVPLPQESTVAANLVALAVAVTVVMSLIIGAVILGLREVITAWTKTPALGAYLWLLPVAMVWFGTYRVLNYWAIRKAAFVRLAQTRATQGVGRIIVQVGLGLLHLKPLGLLIGEVVGQSAGVGSLATLTWKQDGEAIRAIRFRGMLQAASRYRRFPFFCVDALLSAASFWAPSLLISNMFGAAVVGGVALALKLVNWPIILVGGAVGQVYTGEAARLMRENPAGQYPLLIKTTRRLAVLGSPLFVIGLAAPFVFAPVFGPKWQQAGLFCAILTPTAYLQLIIAPISALANIAERQHLQLLLDGSRAALIAVVFILAFRGHWAVIPTLIVYVSATTVSYVGYLLLYARVARAISLAHSSKPSAEERFP